MTQTSAQIANTIVIKTILLLGAIPHVGDPMSPAAWRIAEHVADEIVQWREAKKRENPDAPTT